MGPPVSRAPPFIPVCPRPPCFVGLGGGAGAPGRAVPAASLVGSGTGDFPQWHFCSRKVGTSEIWWRKGSREQLGGSAACWGLPAARHRRARCWGKLPRPLLASAAVRAQPCLGTPASASQGKGSESMHQARLFTLFPPAPGGKSSTFGRLRVSWLPAAKEDPRPPAPVPVLASAALGSGRKLLLKPLPLVWTLSFPSLIVKWLFCNDICLLIKETS